MKDIHWEQVHNSAACTWAKTASHVFHCARQQEHVPLLLPQILYARQYVKGLVFAQAHKKT
jgi:hypothetical protein